MRAFIFVLDSLGIGQAPDAADFGDVGSDTLGHIATECAKGHCDERGHKGALHMPNLAALGMAHAHYGATNKELDGIARPAETIGLYGWAKEISRGKDTPSGHWEIAGLPVEFDWGLFPETIPCFPEELVSEFLEKTGLKGILANKHSSGTVVLDEFGEEHIKTGYPICYTSADSVFQIAAHEKHFGLKRLLEICEIAKPICDKYNIGRVIARPFVGESKGNFTRTANRRDYTTEPHGPTMLDYVVENGGQMVSVGKIADIYAHRSVTKKVKGKSNKENIILGINEFRIAQDKDLVFVNLVDFDALYGHRRDPAGYAAAIEEFDTYLPEILSLMTPDDLLLVTADHGCDPTYHGTDHTREYVPVLFYSPSFKGRSVGERATFADMGQTICHWLGTKELAFGKSVLDD
ncbi:MAG: phosphopentomutase [Alphaproteobacteria bacterium]